MAGRLIGKVGIVTGGGQGVGRGIALACAREGASVVLAELRAESAAAVAAEIEKLGAAALAVPCDVTRRPDVEATVARAIEAFGRIDFLVNNAQVAPKRPVSVLEHTDEIVDLSFDSGFRGTLYFMQACYPHLKKSSGRVINVGSAAGLNGMAGQAGYGAAKEAIRALSKSAAREWGADGITVNVLCPFARSPSVAAFLEAAPDLEAQMTAGQPIGRIGDCETDIGPVAAFLASDDARYVTGQTLPVDGGNCMIR